MSDYQRFYDRLYDQDRLDIRMQGLGLPCIPSFYLEADELHRLACADDREIIAWSVTEKLLQGRKGGSFLAEFHMAIDPTFQFSEIIVHQRET